MQNTLFVLRVKPSKSRVPVHGMYNIAHPPSKHQAAEFPQSCHATSKANGKHAFLLSLFYLWFPFQNTYSFHNHPKAIWYQIPF